MINVDYTAPASGICTNRPNPYYILGYVLNTLTWHFSSATNIQEPSLKQYLWAPDNLDTQQITSKILITPLTKWDINKAMGRPSIVLSREDLTSTPDVIGSRLRAVQALMGDVDPSMHPTAGQEAREYPCDMALTLFCLHVDGAAAELLGWEVFEMLNGWAGKMEDELNLHQFKPVRLGKPGKLEESKIHWAVPVQCAVNFRVQHIIRPGAPLLKGIVPALSTE